MRIVFSKIWTLYSLLTVAVLLALGILHAGYLEDDKTATIGAIYTFHAEIGSGNPRQIYDSASPEFKNAQSGDDFIKVVQRVLDTAGYFRRVNSFELTVIVDSPVPSVRAICQSSFEKSSVTEFFTFVRSGRKLKLANYKAAVGWFELHQDEVNAAKAGVSNFYRELRDRDISAIWAASDNDLKHSMTEGQFGSLITEVQNRYGKCGPPGLVDMDFVENAQGRFVGLLYIRHCELGGLTERFAWRVVSGIAFLRGYRTN